MTKLAAKVQNSTKKNRRRRQLMVERLEDKVMFAVDTVNSQEADAAAVSAMASVNLNNLYDGYVNNQGAELAVDVPLDAQVEAALKSLGDFNTGTGNPPLHPLTDTFLLHSNPGAQHVIYLDFDGHTTSNTFWNTDFNGGNDIVTPAYDLDGNPATFSNAELTQIQRIWLRVAEDYLPFNVDVTTEEPPLDSLRRTGASDLAWGIRTVIGPDVLGTGAGGIAYLTSFTYANDTPAFVFNTSEIGVAEAISHEVGHSLGLSHDGENPGDGEYYLGNNGWAPIMGAGYYEPLTQWSRGEYPNATNMEDDLAIITGGNGFTYRPDDHGNTPGASTVLSPVANIITASGVIERNNDVDYFRFSTVAGVVSFDVTPALLGPNLDVQVSLYNEVGGLVMTANPSGQLDATLTATVAEGNYYLVVSNSGDGDVNVDGYSTYGSLGYYTIDGLVTPPLDVSAPTASASASHVTSAGATTHTITVRYTDDQALAIATIGNGDIQVVGPTGTLNSTLVSVDITTDGPVRVATYTITAPGGTWDATDNGLYTIEMVASQVADTSGNFVPAGVIGTFNCNIIPDVSRPTASASATLISSPGTAPKTFTVTYRDNAAVDVTSLDNTDIQVVPPAGAPINATFVSVDVNTNGATRTATYQINPPGGNWDSTDNGVYTIVMASGQVRDTSGNTVNPGAIGTFTVSIQPTDLTIPSATATLSSVGAPATTYTFSVTYRDDQLVNRALIGTGDVIVTGPNGFSTVPALFGATTPATNNAQVIANYRFTAPGGTWDAGDNGIYTVSMVSNQVADTSGNFVPGGVLGTFTVSVNDPSIARIYGTVLDDRITIDINGGSVPVFVVNVNGVSTTLASTVRTVELDTVGNSDRVIINGGVGNESATFRYQSVQLVGSGYQVQVVNAERIQINARGGVNTAQFYGSISDEQFAVYGYYQIPRAYMATGDSFNYAVGFDTFRAEAIEGGVDTAEFYSYPENYTWIDNSPVSATLITNSVNYAEQFDKYRLRFVPYPYTDPTAALDATTFSGNSSISVIGPRRYYGDDWIAVDPNESYHLSGWARSGDGMAADFAPAAKQYFGFASYDSDLNLIDPTHVLKYTTAVDTRLAAPLVAGATTIQLNDVTGWSNSSTAHTRSLAWYGYANSDGEVYADYTYTRNVLVDAWAVGRINYTTNTITLRTPWAGPDLAVGTAFRNAMSGSTFNYAALAGENVGLEWTQYEADITGTGLGDAQFRPGTAYVKPLVLANWSNGATNQVSWREISLATQHPLLYTGGEKVDLRSSIYQVDTGYSWTQLAGPPVAFTGANRSVASFTAPLSATSYTLQFQVQVTGPQSRTETISVQIDPPIGPASSGVTVASDATTFSGSENYTVVGSAQTMGDDMIAVNIGQTYELSGLVRSGNGSGGLYQPGARQYFGFVSYDSDGLMIEPLHVMKFGAATDTRLFADLLPGQTVVQLNDVTGWSNAGASHTRSLAWYGYTNTLGVTYDDYTYTRNVLTNAWDVGSVDFLANTITLRTPWAGPALLAGTAIRNAASGSTYNYAGLANESVGQNWTQIASEISGVGNAANQFRAGTAFIQIIIRANYSGGPSNQINWTDVALSPKPAQQFFGGNPIDLRAETEGAGLSYNWSQISGPTAAFTGNGTRQIHLTAPSQATPFDMVFRVNINGGSLPLSQRVTIRVLPSSPTPSAPQASLAFGAAPQSSLSPLLEEAAYVYWFNNGSQLPASVQQVLATIEREADSAQSAAHQISAYLVNLQTELRDDSQQFFSLAPAAQEKLNDLEDLFHEAIEALTGKLLSRLS
ncbi:zinc-dependent metalloprotease family protein [Lignipirellula cremea]|nr:zinc-dependent metalloprotease family protein [Lignipirellula cremea]